MASTSNNTSPMKSCGICNVDVTSPHWARHQTTTKHLRNWGMAEGIYDFESKSPLELSKLQRLMRDRKTVDYSMYNLDKLQLLAQEKNLEVVPGISREKLIRRLYKIDEYSTCKLHLFKISKVRELAKNLGLWFKETDDKNKLIQAICKKKRLFYCTHCKLAVKDEELHNASEKHCSKIGAGLSKVHQLTTARGGFKTTIYNNTLRDNQPPNVAAFLNSIMPKILDQVRTSIQNRQSVKFYISLDCQYKRQLVNGGHQLTSMIFHTKADPIYAEDDLSEAIGSHFDELQIKEDTKHPAEGSGWSLDRIKRVMVKVADFNPLSGSSYIKLPKWIESKKACINIQNTGDNKCFIYSILCALNEPKDHSYKSSKYTSQLNDEIFQGFEYPMNISQIPKFELKSRESNFPGYPPISVNVYEIGPNNGDIRPIYVSKFAKTSPKATEIDLLLLHSNNKYHYVYIKNLSRLVRSQITCHNGHIYICRRCLSHFHSQGKLDEHNEYCGDHKPCVMSMPKPGTKVEFINFTRKFPHPYVIYADFETLNIDQVHEENAASTVKVKRHIPYGFAVYLVSRVNNEKFSPFVYRATSDEELKNVSKTFVKCLHKILLVIAEKYDDPKPLNLSESEENAFQAAMYCHICEHPFADDMNIKVRDHCHLEGVFLGAAHQKCNLNRRLVTRIPVVLHNLSNFDSHLFIENLFQYNKKSKLRVIANSEEKYITFEKNMFKVGSSKKYYKLSFVDSFRFLGSSLEKLANNLERSQMHHLDRFVRKHSKSHTKLSNKRAFQMLRGKGVFPYDFIDSLSKLNCNYLLPKDNFYDSLNDSKISTTDYLKYKLVWTNLHQQTLGHYSDLYNLQDVVLLADVFENFRGVCLDNYQLDPAYYLTAPSLAWDAMLKMTKSRIELLSDPDMHLMVERGIRGGIAQVCKRHVVANNQFIEGYDGTKPTNYIMYLDACNLYGWALSQPLPYQNFQWVDPQVLELERWISMIQDYSENSTTGCIFEIDASYPEALHNPHRDIPFAAEHYKNKLCTTLLDKKKYVVHVGNLKQMLDHGLILSKIHRIISFDQKAFIRKYVEFNSGKRQLAQNEFEKNFYKLMVNSVFGRTMMNLRKRQNIELCDEARASKIVKKPSFSRFTIFSPDFLACHTLKNKLYLNQPIQVGCAVLELSKFLMYQFWYDKLKIWDPSAALILMDTDSYVIEMSEDPYQIIRNNMNDFDTSNYPHDHPLYSPINKNVPGKMKDELAGIPITEVCGLRAKLYTYLYKNKSEIRCKGIKKSVARKCIRMEHFKSALYDNQNLYTNITNIRSSKHVLYTEKQRKLALSAGDEKRFILENKVETLPWGHCQIPEPMDTT